MGWSEGKDKKTTLTYTQAKKTWKEHTGLTIQNIPWKTKTTNSPLFGWVISLCVAYSTMIPIFPLDPDFVFVRSRFFISIEWQVWNIYKFTSACSWSALFTISMYCLRPFTTVCSVLLVIADVIKARMIGKCVTFVFYKNTNLAYMTVHIGLSSLW